MKKRVLCILVALSAPLLLNARIEGSEFLRRLQLGIEWGYSQSVFKYHHYNIISNEGYRIDEKSEGFYFNANGMLLANIGYDLSDRFNIALYSGYAGFSDESRVLPLSLRLSVFPGSTIYEDGFYSFIEGGVGLKFKNLQKQESSFFASVGEAYRIKLSPYFNLDFILSLRVVFDKPIIYSPDGSGQVDKHNIRANNAQYYALNFSIALNF